MTASAAPTLRELQLLVWKLLVAPEGARPGLAELARAGELDEETLSSWIRGDERLDAVGRVDVYANMYFFRLHDVLAEDFEKTAAILGGPRFHNLVVDYLLAHPSSHPSLRWAGRSLPAFLASHPTGGEFPWAADMAALEWAKSDAFQAADAPVLHPEALAAYEPESWGALVLTARPCVSLVPAAWDVWDLFGKLEDGAAPFEPARRKVRLLVHRPRFAAEIEELEDEEGRALAAVLAGRTFGEVCEALAAAEEDVEAAAARAARYLAGWLDRELFSSARLKQA